MAEGVASFDIAFAPVKNAANVWFTYSLSARANYFRLLHIPPSLTNAAAIQCNLLNGSINEQILTAGSYVRTPLTPTRRIVLNGAPIQVQHNLYNFLQAFSNVV
ncbi:hypothetical protein HBI71_190470 [Parastagonospora nodorum]|nr:hypothetical protein HBI71_190470 [Parastagonospora nodorum]